MVHHYDHHKEFSLGGLVTSIVKNPPPVVFVRCEYDLTWPGNNTLVNPAFKGGLWHLSQVGGFNMMLD